MLKTTIVVVLSAGLLMAGLALVPTSEVHASEEMKRSGELKKLTKPLAIHNMVRSGKIKFLGKGAFSVEASSGYICDSESGNCVCQGGEASEDCQAMFKNICPTDESGNPEYSCIGDLICSCNFRGVGDLGGLDRDPAETQTPG